MKVIIRVSQTIVLSFQTDFFSPLFGSKATIKASCFAPPKTLPCKPEFYKINVNRKTRPILFLKSKL